MTDIGKGLAVVTGGTRGIGASISTTLRDNGYKVVACYCNNPENAVKFSNDTGIDIKRFDVKNYSECESAIALIKEELGNIDILVNNAGIAKDAMLHKMDPDDWYDVINTNLTSCFNMCRAVIGDMRDNRYGRIVNISSVNAQIGQIGQVNYAASKAGIIGLTKALARESASHNITVNAIAPGYVATDILSKVPEAIMTKIISLIPMKRLGSPNEIARAVMFLVDRDASFITGETLSVNGGHNML